MKSKFLANELQISSHLLPLTRSPRGRKSSIGQRMGYTLNLNLQISFRSITHRQVELLGVDGIAQSVPLRAKMPQSFFFKHSLRKMSSRLNICIYMYGASKSSACEPTEICVNILLEVRLRVGRQKKMKNQNSLERIDGHFKCRFVQY